MNPKSRKLPKFTPTLKGVLAIINFSLLRVGAKKVKNCQNGLYKKVLYFIIPTGNQK
jgi:hypothetical protein